MTGKVIIWPLYAPHPTSAMFCFQVLVRADVAEVLFTGTDASATACGVRLVDGSVLQAPLVVSSVGYLGTFSKLVPPAVTQVFKVGPPSWGADGVGPCT